MAADIRFFVIDSKTGEPLSGVRIIVLADYTSSVTGSDGRCVVTTQYQGALAYTAEKIGYKPVRGGIDTSADVEWKVLLTPEEETPKPPQPPNIQKPGQEKIGEIGTSCDLLILQKYTHDVYFYQNRNTGKKGVQHRSKGDAVRDGNADPGCFLPLPPLPGSAIEQEKQERKEDVGKLNGLIAEIQDFLAGLQEKVLGWVEDAFISILEKVLEQEKKT